DEGRTPRRAALLGVIVREHRAFVADAVDVRRFPDHQAAVVDARLHPADVVAHDEEDVGLLLLLRGRRQTRRHTDGDECRQGGPKLSHEFHGKPPYLSASWVENDRATPHGIVLLLTRAVFTAGIPH